MKEETVRVSSKGQIVIPTDLREKLNIDKGRKMILVEKDGVIIMKPIRKLSELKGILRTRESVKEIIKELRAEWDTELG
jgi:AbrB family looped-hinge helix DNA binding protein